MCRNSHRYSLIHIRRISVDRKVTVLQQQPWGRRKRGDSVCMHGEKGHTSTHPSGEVPSSSSWRKQRLFWTNGKQLLLGLPQGILEASPASRCPSLSLDPVLPTWRSRSSSLTASWVSEILILLLRMSPATFSQESQQLLLVWTTTPTGRDHRWGEQHRMANEVASDTHRIHLSVSFPSPVKISTLLFVMNRTGCCSLEFRGLSVEY